MLLNKSMFKSTPKNLTKQALLRCYISYPNHPQCAIYLISICQPVSYRLHSEI